MTSRIIILIDLCVSVCVPTGKEVSAAGALDEEDFIRAFEDVPTIQVRPTLLFHINFYFLLIISGFIDIAQGRTFCLSFILFIICTVTMEPSHSLTNNKVFVVKFCFSSLCLLGFSH